MVVVDGRQYDDPSLAPDLGTWKCTHVESWFTGPRRFYQGKSADVSKLPTTYPENYLGEGSRAYCLDTKEEYTYCVADQQWYQLP